MLLAEQLVRQRYVRPGPLVLGTAPIKYPAPVTTYALFRDGEFLTHGIQSDKKFLALAGIKG